jgi:hypothetical protein
MATKSTVSSSSSDTHSTPARDRRSTDGVSANGQAAASNRARPMTHANFIMPALPDDLRAQGVFVNLEGDYTYLGDGYYRSMEAEHEGMLAFPSPQAAIDAYVVPLALSKAQAAGIPIPDWEIVNDQAVTLAPPMVAYPINPFQDEGLLIADNAGMTEAFKSLTMSNKYAVVCQAMQADARIDTLRLVLGKCLKPEYVDLADKLWRTFHIPLARVKVIVTEEQYLFSAIQPLKKEELTQNEKAIIKEAGLWRA